MIQLGVGRTQHPLMKLLMAAVGMGALLNGMLWRAAPPFDIWDVVTHPSWARAMEGAALPWYCHTAGEVLFSWGVLAGCGARLETQWGTANTTRYVLAASCLALVIRLWFVRLLPEHSVLVPGPYFAVASIAYAAARQAPRAPLFHMYGIPVHCYTPSFLFLAQLATLHAAASLLMVVSGLLGGMVACSAAYRHLPLPSCGRIWAALLPPRPAKVTVLTTQTVASRFGTAASRQ
eukprot:TRINITY_DN7556_c0_g2_i1.p1 TRINITY_DN7556_c0_g2~~TRINITY_DN7556_c0_g2_i1.p1  ORF type:complete len:234 (+),score=42.17 TRINITY_DN7556_c0_g2_i1:876-1577(+)